MSAPAASVLVPVYNGEPFLAECLDSILAQEFGDYELLISDDGSTDGSAALIERYAARDHRIRWWRNPHNQGIGGNFNASLRAARGEYVKYVLQDDKLLAPSVLGRMVAEMERNHSASLVASACELIDECSQRIRTRCFYRRAGVRDGKEVIVHCLEDNANRIGEPSLVMFRRTQALRGFDEDLRQIIDLELWFHLLEQGSFAYLAEPLCAFRQHPAQLSEVNWRERTCADEGLRLSEQYLFKPWMKDAATPQMLFNQAYYLRKYYGEKAMPVVARLRERLGSRAYAALWVRHRLTKPFRNFRDWLGKRAT